MQWASTVEKHFLPIAAMPGAQDGDGRVRHLVLGDNARSGQLAQAFDINSFSSSHMTPCQDTVAEGDCQAWPQRSGHSVEPACGRALAPGGPRLGPCASKARMKIRLRRVWPDINPQGRKKPDDVHQERLHIPLQDFSITSNTNPNHDRERASPFPIRGIQRQRSTDERPETRPTSTKIKADVCSRM